MTTNEKNLIDVRRKIKQVAEALNLNQSKVRADSYNLFEEIEKSQELKGRSLEAKVAIVIFMISRRFKRDIKIHEIKDYTFTTDKEIAKCYKRIKNSQIGNVDTRKKPSDEVKKVCMKLKYVEEVQRAAVIVADNFIKHNICEGKKPGTIAGCSIYISLLKMRNPPDNIDECLHNISLEVNIGV